MRSDQDRIGVAHRPDLQIQPAAPHRGGTRRQRSLCMGPSPLNPRPIVAPLAILIAASLSCVCSRQGGSDDGVVPSALAKAFQLDQKQAQADLAVLTEGPHPFGSDRQGQVLAYLEQRL